MGLKSDGWIRKMALEHKMIEPFDRRASARRGDFLRVFLLRI